MPAFAVRTREPLSEPLPGLAASAAATLPVKVVAKLPNESSAVAVNPKLLPTVTLDGGCVVINNCVAVPGDTTKLLLVTGNVPGAEACSVYPLAA